MKGDNDYRCEGGRVAGKDRSGKLWRGCPPDYVFMENVDDSAGDDEDLTSQLCTVKVGEDKKSSVSSASLQGAGIAAKLSADTVALLGASKSTSLKSAQDDEDSVDDQVAAAKARLAALKKKGEQMETLVELQKLEQIEHAKQTRLLTDLKTSDSLHGGDRPKIRDTAALLRARNQSDGQNMGDQGFYEGLTMPQIRKTVGLAGVVDSDVEHVRSDVASLAHHPSAPSSGRGRKVKKSSVFVSDLVDLGGDFPPPSRAKSVRLPQSVDLLGDDPLTDASEDDDEEAGQQFILTYRRDEHGNKYRTYDPVLAEASPEPEIKPVFAWFTDPQSGRQYKKQINKCKLTQARSKSQVSLLRSQSHERGSFSTQARSASLRPKAVTERTPAFIPLAAPEREGKPDQNPLLIDWVKKCPVMWADKIKSDNMNIVVWLWGCLSEILASRTGTHPELGPGELEARLQHILCTLEVCASHSDLTDFDHHGWKIARLYAKKVQAQLDRGLVSWEDFEIYRSNPHPSELIAAKQELEPKLSLPGKKKKEEEPVRPKGQCPTWNTSKVERKCEWMERNPGKGSCNRKHECTYCKEKGYGTTHHQRTFCGKRIAAGEA